ncbi:hypothetical protein B0H17DRAFT_1197687 [Mycena rosella]|uniref:Uncharacterized protein n=1 Tax=Mycena rosella TaxID=1033263 RepID=A0AAD7GIZ0_MYCRO|nr:hypothetical protein B0H17DRAFT_1197687 [Mycena rosella]
MDRALSSARGADVAKLLRRTPNLQKLTLGFSGHMSTYVDCLGKPLLDTLCALKDVEEFTHTAMTASRQTDFGLHSLLRLAASWPLHCIAGGLECTEDVSGIPPVTCPLKSVTLEACTANLDDLALLFAGSATSLKTLEIWSIGPGSLDTPLAVVLPALESLKLGGCNHPSPAFLRGTLSTAPKLRTLQLGGDPDRFWRVRTALTTALVAADSAPRGRKRTRVQGYPVLKHLAYPALEQLVGAKENEDAEPDAEAWTNIGEVELKSVAAARGIVASHAPDLIYKGEWNLRRIAVKTREGRADGEGKRQGG